MARPGGLAPALPLALFPGGCAAPLSTLQPGGPAAGSVAVLWWAMLGGAALLAVLVAVLVLLAFRRRRARPPASAKLWLGWLGLGLPAAVLVPLLGAALLVGEGTLPTPAPGTVAVEARAQQSDWTFRQPGAAGPIETAGTLHIPAGVPVDVHISTADVIHSFWVPQLAGKMDAVPGRVNVLRIEAFAPGTFAGRCAEFCGVGHTGMAFEVVAHDPAGWAAFQAGDGR